MTDGDDAEQRQACRESARVQFVFADADEDWAVDGMINAMRFTRQSQSCTAGSRLFLHQSIFDSFLDKLTKKVAKLKIGDPIKEETDVGTIINPSVVEGQIIGGIAQGIGEALLEEIVYDEQGQPRTVTLADYLVPSALDVPRIELHHANTPSAALGGFKGCGEGSIIGALSAISCAVADALSQRGGDIHEFPATPERVLRGLGVLPGGA